MAKKLTELRKLIEQKAVDEALKKVARNLLILGMDEVTVSKVMEMDLETVKKLKITLI